MYISGMMSASFTQASRRAKKPMRIGTELMPLTSSMGSAKNDARKVVAHDKLDLSGIDAKSLQALAAMQGQERTFTVNNMTMTLKEDSDGSRTLLVKQKGQEDQTFTFTGDARLVQGKNGQMELVSGKEALSGGVLRAQSEGEVLLRQDAKVVDTGKFSASVVSLGSGPATYTSSGGKTVYTGVFNESTITDTGGEASFFGLFNKSTVSVTGMGNFDGAFKDSFVQGGKGGNTFHGSYASSEVRGDAGKDIFSGNFIHQSKLFGMDGNDIFNGVFSHSELDAGKGNDSIGREGMLVYNEVDKLYDLAATIMDSTIVGGEGDDTLNGVMARTQSDLGEGDNTAFGLYVDSTLTTGGGKDTVNALYGKNSKFVTGDGDDSLSIATAVGTEVDAGKGKNSVLFGVPEGEFMTMNTSTGSTVTMNDLLFSGSLVGPKADAFGKVEQNHVSAMDPKGETTVTAWVDGISHLLTSFAESPEDEETKAQKEMEESYEKQETEQASGATSSHNAQATEEALPEMTEKEKAIAAKAEEEAEWMRSHASNYYAVRFAQHNGAMQDINGEKDYYKPKEFPVKDDIVVNKKRKALLAYGVWT
ncbi:calcium-binding protein [Desulfovibrio cuneatus]|uniref:calcium-binding protein n=1 Tax=Desulfovibrio cuneatus TaxID=159728 RepID=UPI0004841B2B|nr:calcium-binding protein [Desulfovibrio cuneatus]